MQRALRLLDLDSCGSGDEHEERAGVAADLALLRDALSTLPERYQEVISLRYLADLEPAEAAAALGCTKAVLAVTLHRATKALRKAIDSRRESP